eukprot:SAG31_NODE_44964_length_260_cov_1.279503_1_plen_86_part_11
MAIVRAVRAAYPTRIAGPPDPDSHRSFVELLSKVTAIELSPTDFPQTAVYINIMSNRDVRHATCRIHCDINNGRGIGQRYDLRAVI